MKRILLVRTDRVGDVVTITPVIRELRKQFPDSFIGTLTRPNTKAVLLYNPHVDILIEDDLENKSFWEVVKIIRGYKFTDALLLMPTERAAYQLFFAGIKNRIGVGRKLYEVITFMKSVSRNNYIPLRHEADYNMDLARKLGVVSNNLKPEIFLSDDEREEGIQVIKEITGDTKCKKIILHIGSGNSAPNWSEENYFKLITLLLNSEDIEILLTANEMSNEFLSKIKMLGSDKIFDVRDRIKELRQFIKVISVVDLVVGPSTGPLHLADGLNVPAVVIHCHRPMSCAARWGMQNPESVNLEVSGKHCDKYCSSDKERCDIENGITPEHVCSTIIRSLSL